VGFVVDKVALELGFPPVFRLPLPVIIPQTSPHSCTIQGWYSRPNSVCSLTPTSTNKIEEREREIGKFLGVEMTLHLGRWHIFFSAVKVEINLRSKGLFTRE
jgi:hypothetical protein